MNSMNNNSLSIHTNQFQLANLSNETNEFELDVTRDTDESSLPELEPTKSVDKKEEEVDLKRQIKQALLDTFSPPEMDAIFRQLCTPTSSLDVNRSAKICSAFDEEFKRLIQANLPKKTSELVLEDATNSDEYLPELQPICAVNTVLEEVSSDEVIINQDLVDSLNRLNPSESDLGLNLNEYIFSEWARIYNEQKDRQIILDKCSQEEIVNDALCEIYFMTISYFLFGPYDERQLNHYVKSFCECLQGDKAKDLVLEDTAKTLLLVTKYGRGAFDKPLYEILSKKSPYRKDNPEENVLSSMRICINWMSYIVKTTNYYLVLNEILVHKLKLGIKTLKGILTTHDFQGFNANFLTAFSAFSNIHANFKNIDEIIEENAVDQLQKSAIGNDHIYLKFKNKFNVYATIKNLCAKAKSIHNVALPVSEKIIKCQGSHQVTSNGKGTTLILDWGNEIGRIETITNLIENSSRLLEMCLGFVDDRFSKLCEDYEAIRGVKTDAEINRALADLLFGDEPRDSNIRAKKISAPLSNITNTLNSNNQKKTVKGKNNAQGAPKKGQASGNKGKIQKQTNVTGKIRLAPAPVISNEMLSPEQILSDHSQYIYTLSKAIKKDLVSKTAGDSGIELNRSQIHSKELQTHLQYAFLNFDLFCKAIQSQDLYAIGAIVPFLCMDLHTSLEQMQKRQILMKKMQPSTSHKLSELYTYSKCALSPDQSSFVDEFSDAMLQARYPVSHAYKGPNGEVSEPLKWMQYSQKLCEAIANGRENTVDSNELAQLCDFVFNSYSMTLQCVLQELNIEPKISELSSQQSKSILNLKKTVLGSITDNNNDPVTQAIKLKNLAPSNKNAKQAPKSYGKTKKVQISEKNAKSILEISQNLCEVGDGILKRFDGVEANRLEKILNETTSLLGRIDAVDYLQKKYDNMRYAGLHHRNLLMFQWIYEHLYRFNGHLEGLNDLRWVCNHNLETFHALAFPEKPLPTELKEFNFIRNVHYNHEVGDGQSQSMMKKLLQTRKVLNKYDYEGWLRPTSKKDMAAKLESHRAEFAENRSTIFQDGKALSESLLKMTATR